MPYVVSCFLEKIRWISGMVSAMCGLHWSGKHEFVCWICNSLYHAETTVSVHLVRGAFIRQGIHAFHPMEATHRWIHTHRYPEMRSIFSSHPIISFDSFLFFPYFLPPPLPLLRCISSTNWKRSVSSRSAKGENTTTHIVTYRRRTLSFTPKIVTTSEGRDSNLPSRHSHRVFYHICLPISSFLPLVHLVL